MRSIFIHSIIPRPPGRGRAGIFHLLKNLCRRVAGKGKSSIFAGNIKIPEKMKKSSLILNVILLISVVVLYVLYFTGKSTSGEASVQPVAGTVETGTGDGSIVYVNMDTLLANYDMFADLQDRLQKKQQASESKLNARGQKWQNKVNEFQSNLQKGLVTRSEAQKIQNQLQQEQQEIMKLKDDLANQLLEEQQVGTRKVIFSIVDFLDDYSQEHHYRYVLSTTAGGAVLYGEKQLDVTQEVLEGLNAKYKTVRDSVLHAF